MDLTAVHRLLAPCCTAVPADALAEVVDAKLIGFVRQGGWFRVADDPDMLGARAVSSGQSPERPIFSRSHVPAATQPAVAYPLPNEDPMRKLNKGIPLSLPRAYYRRVEEAIFREPRSADRAFVPIQVPLSAAPAPAPAPEAPSTPSTPADAPPTETPRTVVTFCAQASSRTFDYDAAAVHRDVCRLRDGEVLTPDDPLVPQMERFFRACHRAVANAKWGMTSDHVDSRMRAALGLWADIEGAIADMYYKHHIEK